MFEQMKWKDAYELWQRGSYCFPDELTTPLSAETVSIKFEQDGFIYGYDWLEAKEARERKQLAENNPVDFLYFTKPSNKGTIRTAEMLIEAQNEEELAAIWIAATAKELSESGLRNGVGCYADLLHMAACEFLKSRYVLWHHAMKNLVPDVVIPSSVLMNISCENAEPVIGLIQMNTIILKNNFRILRYSSLEEGAFPESRCRTLRFPR